MRPVQWNLRSSIAYTDDGACCELIRSTIPADGSPMVFAHSGAVEGPRPCQDITRAYRRQRRRLSPSACASGIQKLRFRRRFTPTKNEWSFMTLKLPDLPYAYDALAPFMSAETLAVPPRQASPRLRRKRQQAARWLQVRGPVDRRHCARMPTPTRMPVSSITSASILTICISGSG